MKLLADFPFIEKEQDPATDNHSQTSEVTNSTESNEYSGTASSLVENEEAQLAGDNQFNPEEAT